MSGGRRTRTIPRAAQPFPAPQPMTAPRALHESSRTCRASNARARIRQHHAHFEGTGRRIECAADGGNPAVPGLAGIRADGYLGGVADPEAGEVLLVHVAHGP